MSEKFDFVIGSEGAYLDVIAVRVFSKWHAARIQCITKEGREFHTALTLNTKTMDAIALRWLAERGVDLEALSTAINSYRAHVPPGAGMAFIADRDLYELKVAMDGLIKKAGRPPLNESDAIWFDQEGHYGHAGTASDMPDKVHRVQRQYDKPFLVTEDGRWLPTEEIAYIEGRFWFVAANLPEPTK